MATYAAYRHVELDNVGYGKKRVLKPPGGGSSDIFGTGPEETSARRVKQHNQSQLSSTLFGSDATNQNNAGSNGPEKVAARTKPGNDSYKRLFGPPDAPAVSPNSKNHMRSNISLSGGGDLSSPEKSTRRSSSSTIISSSSNGCLNGHASSNACYNDITGGNTCITRNPVTGFGIEITPPRRTPRRCRDVNPVTGATYDQLDNGVTNGTVSPSSTSSGEKSSEASSPQSKAAARSRVPPGGYSSGLW
ncbi:microtubule-associated protein Jupiter isoform X6 [Prorops nasuta]|uniref:microtubule-associated protein Jupiter isoform X6 n=1 Tax=Prorops nasuta TaxID=863751 RepID=UPI0034CE8AB4